MEMSGRGSHILKRCFCTNPQLFESGLPLFDRKGYFKVSELFESGELGLFENICDSAKKEAVDVSGLRRIEMYEESEPSFMRLIFSKKIQDVVTSILGNTFYYQKSEIIIKDPRSQSSIPWSQGSGAIPFRHIPWVSVWVMVDDMSGINGTLSVLPFGKLAYSDQSVRFEEEIRPRSDVFKCFEHIDGIGYFGDEAGDEISGKAGSIVVTSSLAMTRSAPNITDRAGRLVRFDYTTDPLEDPDTGRIIFANDPFIIDGYRMMGGI